MLRRYSSPLRQKIRRKDSLQISYHDSICSPDDDYESGESNKFIPSHPETSCSSLSAEYHEEEQKQNKVDAPKDDNDWADFEGLDMSNCYLLKMVNCEQSTLEKEEEASVMRHDKAVAMSFLEAAMQYEPCVGEEMASITVSLNDKSLDDDNYVYGRHSNGDNKLETMVDNSSMFTSLYGNDSHNNMIDRLPLQTKWARYFFTDHRVGHVSVMEDDSVDIDIDTLYVESAMSISSLSSLGEHESIPKGKPTRGEKNDQKVETGKTKSRSDGRTKKRFGCLSRFLKPCKTM